MVFLFSNKTYCKLIKTGRYITCSITSLCFRNMAVNLFALTTRALTRTSRFAVQSAAMSVDRSAIGNREIVGYGFNGMPIYVDRPDFPLPAIRWKEPSADIIVS